MRHYENDAGPLRRAPGGMNLAMGPFPSLVRDLIPKESLATDRIEGVDQIMADALAAKFIPALLTPEQFRNEVAFGWLSEAKPTAVAGSETDQGISCCSTGPTKLYEPMWIPISDCGR